MWNVLTHILSSGKWEVTSIIPTIYSICMGVIEEIERYIEIGKRIVGSLKNHYSQLHPLPSRRRIHLLIPANLFIVQQTRCKLQSCNQRIAAFKLLLNSEVGALKAKHFHTNTVLVLESLSMMLCP